MAMFLAWNFLYRMVRVNSPEHIYIYHFDFNIDFGDAPPCHVPLWILLYRCHVDNFLNGIYNDDLRVGGMGSSSLPPKSSDPNFHWFVVGYIFFQRNIC